MRRMKFLIKPTNMKKIYNDFRDTFIAGVIFLLPLLVLFVLITKVFQYLTGFTTKIAALFGLKGFMGISGGTIVSAAAIILLCVLCGVLVRVSFFKAARDWVDSKMMTNIPGYSTYREMALAKLEEREDALPYKSALWLKLDKMNQPGFLIEKMPDGKLVVFIPTAGNVKEGTVLTLAEADVQLCPNANMRAFQMAISNLGLGLGKAGTGQG
jgi:uncharacterized membrane protein